MKVVAFFLVVFSPIVLFGQTSVWTFEVGCPIINKYRSGSIKGFDTTLTWSIWDMNYTIGLKYMPNVEKPWVYGISLSSGEVEGSRLSLPKETTIHGFSWQNYGGYIGYQVFQRKHFGLTVGLLPELTMTKYNRYNDTVSIMVQKPYFRINPEMDIDFKMPFGDNGLFMTSLRLKYEMPTHIMPSKLSLGLILKLGGEYKKPYIQYVQKKGAHEIFFYVKSLPLGSDLVWDFGDGTTSKEKTPTKIYEESGEYTVTITGSRLLSGTDDNGNSWEYTDTKTATTMVKIGNGTSSIGRRNPPLIKQPFVSAYFDVVTIDNKERLVSFKNMSKTGNVFYWDFGDRETATVQNPTHSFLYKGAYKVKLIVTDILTGETATYEKKIKFK
jgi:hypothetical protein